MTDEANQQNPESGFSPADYRALLQAFIDRGYGFVDLAKLDKDAAHVFLRHDIDFCCELAVPISDIERELAIASVYYVQVASPFYNPMEARQNRALRQILANGHAIGLHLDARAVLPEATEHEADAHIDLGLLQDRAGLEISLLRAATGADVHSISFHRPVKALIGTLDTLAGLPSLYGARYFNDIGYCSDSRGGWHHGHPLNHPAVAGGKALQLLTHPIWWIGAADTGAMAQLESFVEDRDAQLRTDLARNCATYRKD